MNRNAMSPPAPPGRASWLRAVLLRDAVPADRAFQLALYAATHADEIAQFGWQAQLQHEFVVQQFEAQGAHFLRHHPDAACQIMEMRQCPIGRLLTAREATTLTLLDISLIPDLQRHGIASECLRRELLLADEAGLKVELQVAVDSPARQLFERLGFRALGEPGLRQAMRRLPLHARQRTRAPARSPADEV